MKNLVLAITLISVSLISFNQTVLFEDSFFNNNNKWYEENTAIGKMEIVSKLDQYHIYHKQKSHAYISLLDVKLDNSRNFRIESLIYKKGGTKHSGYGIIWGAKDRKNLYSLMVTGDGGWLYGKIEDGSWKNISDGWKDSEAIETGRKGFNKFRVDKIGNQYSFYINDIVIARSSVGTLYGNKIGFNVNRKQKIIVEWIKVSYLN